MRAGARSLALPLIATIVVAFVLFGVALRTKHEADRLRIMTTAPRASLDAPIMGPAIYEGTLSSSYSRVSPLGKKSAAFWWWVEQKSGKSWKVICSKAVRDTMVLRADRSSMKLTSFSAPNLSLLADTREDWTEPLIVDLGALPYEKPSAKIPSEANECAAAGRTYMERRIPEGTRVEVLGCHRDGELRACEGPLAGVLSVPTLDVHRIRRRDHLMSPIRAAASFAIVLLLALAGANTFLRKRILGPLSKRGAR